jgi:hypothetical protein
MVNFSDLIVGQASCLLSGVRQDAHPTAIASYSGSLIAEMVSFPYDNFF